MKAFISQQSNNQLIDYLSAQGIEISLVEPHANVAEPIACHPDIYMCHLGDSIYVGNLDLLGPKYPLDVLYNCARVGKYFLCSKNASKDLIFEAKKYGLELIYLKQGYVKCNVVIVDDNHIITEDEGIAKTLKAETDIEVLLIQGGFVSLEGYPRGFIGGATGKIGQEIVFNGNLSAHPDYDRIKAFLEPLGVGIKYFEEYPLTDIGSIIIE